MNTPFWENIAKIAKYKFKNQYAHANPASIRIKLYLSENTKSKKITVNLDTDCAIYYDNAELIFTNSIEKSTDKGDGFTIAIADISEDEYIEYCTVIKKFYDYKTNDEFISGYMEEAIKLLCQRGWITQNDVIKY